MTFLSPYYLIALAGLLIPVAIHLWSRKNPKVIPFGSLRFLPKSPVSRRFSSTLTEKILLLTRMLLLAALVLILARPAVPDKEDTIHWVLVDPEIATTDPVVLLADTTRADLRFLSPGFPAYDPEAIPSARISYWALAAAAARRTDSLTVLAGDRLVNYTGKRPRVGIPVQWISVESNMEATEDTLLEYRGTESADYRLLVRSAAAQTSFLRRSSGDSVSTTDPVRVVILSTEDDPSEGYIRLATEAISEYLQYPVTISREPVSDIRPDWAVLLDTTRDTPLAKYTLRLSPPVPGPPVLTTADPREFLLNGPLTDARVHEDGFLEQWAHLLDPFRSDSLEKIIAAADRRKMPFDPAPHRSQVNEVVAGEANLITWPFWLVLFILLIFERYFAHHRHA